MTKLIKWLSDRDLKSKGLLSINSLEKNVGCPKSTIAQALGGHRSLPEKWVKPIETELKRYGYKP